MTLQEIIDAARDRAQLGTDYKLAQAMGIERQKISAWRKHSAHPGTEECVQLAALAGLEEMQVIADVNYEFATNDKKRNFWKEYREHRGIAAAFTMTALACAIILTPNQSDATILQNTNSGAEPQSFYSKNIHYAQQRHADSKRFSYLG